MTHRFPKLERMECVTFGADIHVLAPPSGPIVSFTTTTKTNPIPIGLKL